MDYEKLGKQRQVTKGSERYVFTGHLGSDKQGPCIVVGISGGSDKAGQA